MANFEDFNGEEFPLKLTFKEEYVRGTGRKRCVIVAEDTVEAYPTRDTIEASSWEKILETYPTLEDVLENMFWCEEWRADQNCGPGKRCLYIHEIEGHEGLYEYNPEKTVFVSWEDIVGNDIVEIEDDEEDIDNNGQTQPVSRIAAMVLNSDGHLLAYTGQSTSSQCEEWCAANLLNWEGQKKMGASVVTVQVTVLDVASNK